MMSQRVRRPSVAFGAGNYFVVWDAQETGWSRIYGARVTPAGSVLDAAPFSLPPGEYAQFRPVIQAIGTGSAPDTEPAFLVAWSELTGGVDCRVFATRLTASARVLDAPAFPVSESAPYVDYPTLAFDGTQSLVVWQQETAVAPQRDVYGTRVSRSGVVLDAIPIAIATSSASESRPSATSNGHLFSVSWAASAKDLANSGVRGAWLDASGRVLRSDVPLSEPALGIDSLQLTPYGSGRTLLAYSRVAANGGDRVFVRAYACNGATDCLADPAPSCAVSRVTRSDAPPYAGLAAAAVLVALGRRSRRSRPLSQTR
jgi:hypothetical protein